MNNYFDIIDKNRWEPPDEKVYDMLIDQIQAASEPLIFGNPKIRTFDGTTDWEYFDVKTKTVTGELTRVKNNKTMKYRVKTDQLKRFDEGEILKLADSGNYYRGNELHLGIKVEVVESNPDWFEPVEEVQEGDYIRLEGEPEVFRVKSVDDTVAYPINIVSIEDGSKGAWPKGQLTKLSTDEIEQALIKEAERRGLVEGAKVSTPKNGWEYTLSDGNYDYKYCSGTDELYCHSILIYKNGQWAELVDQTPDIEINGNKVEFNDNPKVGCTTIKKQVFIEQAKTITRHGIRIHRKGEDITDQILAIASHYGYDPKDKGIESLELEDEEGNVMVRFGTGTISYDN